MKQGIIGSLLVFSAGYLLGKYHEKSISLERNELRWDYGKPENEIVYFDDEPRIKIPSKKGKDFNVEFCQDGLKIKFNPIDILKKRRV